MGYRRITSTLGVPTIRPAHRRFGIICVLAYVALSWAGRFDMRLGEQIASLVYPLDTFSMYARPPGEDRSPLLLRDAEGAVHSVTDFRAFDCAEPLSGSGAKCADRHGVPYHFEDLLRHIRSHPGRGDTEMELITRTWQVHPGTAPVPVADCVITRCAVSR